MAIPLRVVVVAALALALAGSALAATVTGTVTSAETRVPLRSMVVAAYDASGSNLCGTNGLCGTATTDPAGVYVLALPAGVYRLLAYDPAGAYATMFDANAESFETSPTVTLAAADNVRKDFALAAGATISGTVTDPGGAFRANAIVAAYNLSGTRRGFTVTDNAGRYTLVLPSGEYKLVAFDDSGIFAASFYRDATNFAAATTVGANAGQPVSAIDFRLGVAARVTGTVTDASTGAPLPSMQVFAYTESGVFVASTVTNGFGAFAFALPAGRYRFVAADPNRVYATSFLATSRSFANALVLPLSASSQTNVTLAMTRGAVLSGRVLNAAGAPLAGITVAAYNADGTLHNAVTTDAQGRYEIVVAPGDVRLAAFDTAGTYASRFLASSNSFAGATPFPALSGQRLGGFDFTLERGGTFSGRVTDAATAQPLAGVVVAAYDAGGALTSEAITGADGRYTIVVPAGTYRLLAFDEQLRYSTRFDGAAKSFETTTPRAIAAGATINADFALANGVKVSGSVTDVSGNPLTGIDVFALDLSGNRVGGGVTHDGAFSLVVPADSYRFVAVDASGRFVTVYYDRAGAFDAARIVNVTAAQPPPPLSFTLSPIVRRRGVRS